MYPYTERCDEGGWWPPSFPRCIRSSSAPLLSLREGSPCGSAEPRSLAGVGVILPSPGSSSFAPGAWSGERGEGCPQEEPCGLRAFLSCLNIWTCAACWIPVEQSCSVVVKPIEGKLSHALLCGQVTGHRGLPGWWGGKAYVSQLKMHGKGVCWGPGAALE